MSGVSIIRSTRDLGSAEAEALVLSAANIPHRLTRVGGWWQLLVAEEDVGRSLAELESYERENLGGREDPAPAPKYGRTWAGIIVACALILFFGVVQSSDASWYSRGAADAAAILDGEAWRAVTALTLHADSTHVVANAVSAAVFATLVFWTLGPGLGGWLIFVSGAAGNLLNAWVHGEGHVSIGASTALFGAVGILSGLQSGRRWRARPGRRGAWLPLAAGFGILAMLGTAGERTDLSAHLFGLVGGSVVGVVTALTLKGSPGAPMQVGLTVGWILTFAGAWVLAFTMT